MKNICLKFFGLGILSSFQASVKIYDDMNNLVYQGTTFDGKLNICLNKCTKYKVIAKFLNQNLINTIYINKLDTYIFIFDNARLNNRLINFILTDSYYNLPIERGNLILWQR